MEGSTTRPDSYSVSNWFKKINTLTGLFNPLFPSTVVDVAQSANTPHPSDYYILDTQAHNYTVSSPHRSAAASDVPSSQPVLSCIWHTWTCTGARSETTHQWWASPQSSFSSLDCCCGWLDLARWYRPSWDTPSCRIIIGCSCFAFTILKHKDLWCLSYWKVAKQTKYLVTPQIFEQ